MKIIVCIKQVPSTNEVRLDPEKHTIIRDGRQSVTNPFDTHGIEAAVQIKEALAPAKTTVTALSMGIPATERLLRDAVAHGADNAVLLTDRVFAGADTLATSTTLKLGIEKIGGFDLIICGKMAVDGDTAQIGPELAAHFGIPCVSDVCEISEITEKELLVKYAVDGGFNEARVKLPAVLTVARTLNQPRFASISGIRSSYEAEFISFGAEDVGADPMTVGLKGSPTKVVKSYAPERDSEAEPITGTASEIASAILKLALGKDGGENA